LTLALLSKVSFASFVSSHIVPSFSKDAFEEARFFFFTPHMIMELSGDILITNQLQPTLAEYLLLCPSAGWNLYTPMPSFNASKGSHYTHSES
jgi:hypothetical protein